MESKRATEMTEPYDLNRESHAMIPMPPGTPVIINETLNAEYTGTP